MLRLSLDNPPYRESVGLLKEMFDNDVEKAFVAVSSDPEIIKWTLGGNHR